MAHRNFRRSMPIGDGTFSVNIPVDRAEATVDHHEDGDLEFVYAVEAAGPPAAWGEATRRPCDVVQGITATLFANLYAAELRGRVRLANENPVDQEIDLMWLEGRIRAGRAWVVPCELRGDGRLVYVPLSPAVLRRKLRHFHRCGGDAGTLAGWTADGVRHAIDARAVLAAVAGRMRGALPALPEVVAGLDASLHAIAGSTFVAFDGRCLVDGADFSVPSVSTFGA